MFLPYKKLIAGLACIVALSGIFLAYRFAVAQDLGLSATAGAAGLTRGAGALTLPQIVGNVIGTALSLIGVIFFALTIYGGFQWMTARGNEETTKKALHTITAAIIGIIIVLASYAITSFVFRSVEGSTVRQTVPAGDGSGGDGGEGQQPQAKCSDLLCAAANGAAQVAADTGEDADAACKTAAQQCTWDPTEGCIFVGGNGACSSFTTEPKCLGTEPEGATEGICQWAG